MTYILTIALTIGLLFAMPSATIMTFIGSVLGFIFFAGWILDSILLNKIEDEDANDHCQKLWAKMEEDDKLWSKRGSFTACVILLIATLVVFNNPVIIAFFSIGLVFSFLDYMIHLSKTYSEDFTNPDDFFK